VHVRYIFKNNLDHTLIYNAYFTQYFKYDSKIDISNANELFYCNLFSLILIMTKNSVYFCL